MAERKTYTENEQTGEEGQRLAASQVTNLGQSWHDRRIDHGIDAVIELVEPVHRSPLNVQVLVQSKATRGRFPGETDSQFHFLVDPADAAYWRSGNNKVVVMCSRPREGLVWWAPFDRATPPESGRKTWKLYFDKETDLLSADSIGRMLQWATPASSYTAPNRRLQAETLQTNLLPIEQLPPTIYFGPSWKSSPRSLGPALRDAGYRRSDWIMRGGVVFSFTRPEADGLGAFLDGGYETIDTSEWAESKDHTTISNFADLLRQGLKEQEHRNLRFHGKKRYFFFRPPPEGRDHKVKVSKSKSGRTVFTRYLKKDDSGDTKDCRHYAADIRFVQTFGGWAAEINPTYHYTHDGYRDLPWGQDRLKGMKSLERNPAVRGLVRFWADYLARQPKLGDSPREIQFGTLMSFDVEVGINDRDWKAPKDDSAIDLTESSQEVLL